MDRPPTPALGPVTSGLARRAPRSSSSPDRRRAANRRSRSNWPTLCGGTIINADSLQIYRDLRILTARPDQAAQARVPHRLYGFLDAGERGSVARWRALALDEIADGDRAPAACRFWSAAPGSTCGRSRRGWRRFRKSPRRSGKRRSSFIGRSAASRFASGWPRLDPAAAQRLFPGDKQRLVRAFEVVRATGVPIGTWQQQTQSAARLPLRDDPARAAARGGFTPRAMPGFVQMIEAGALAEAEALAARRLDPEPAGDEGGRSSRTPVSSAGRDPAR